MPLKTLEDFPTHKECLEHILDIRFSDQPWYKKINKSNALNLKLLDQFIK